MAILHCTSADMNSKEESAHTLSSSGASHGTPIHAAMRATLRGRSSAMLSIRLKSIALAIGYCRYRLILEGPWLRRCPRESRASWTKWRGVEAKRRINNRSGR